MDYNLGLTRLSKLAKDTKWHIEYLSLEARLRDNLSDAGQHGSSEQLRSDRSKIITQLNRFTLEHFSSSFNDLCNSQQKERFHKEVYPSDNLEEPGNSIFFIQNVPISQLVPKNIPLPSPKTIFISYSSKDRAYFEELRAHLTDYIQAGRVVDWDDEEIHPVTLWRKEREKALQTANMVILLVSIDFLKSDFLLHNEMPYILTSANGKTIDILCVIVRPCFFQESPLGHLKTVNSLSQPLSAMSPNERNQIWTKVLEYIKNHLKADC